MDWLTMERLGDLAERLGVDPVALYLALTRSS